MARYNFIGENDVNFIGSTRAHAPSGLHFRGTDVNYLACRYAIHRQLNPPSTTATTAASPALDLFDDYYEEEENQRAGWLDRLFQRLATLGDTQRQQD